MATPVKVFSSAIIPSVTECISCSKGNMLGTGRRYTVIKADGELGSAYADVTAFYEVSFWAPENFGAFVCKQCHREIKRVLDMKENMLKLAEKVLSTSQYLSLQSSNKRVIERTPDECIKRNSRSTEWAPNQLERTQSHDERGGIPDEREWTPNESTERCRSMNDKSTDLRQITV